MKIMHRLQNQETAKETAQFMKIVCYFVVFLFVFMLALSFMGRLQYDLRVGDKTYSHAIYAEKDHEFNSRFLTVSSTRGDDLHIRASATDGTIELISYIAMVLMYALSIVPGIFAYWFLAKVFENVANGEIFVEKNAHYLLYYGVIQAAVAVFVPFIKLVIVQIANILVADSISLATGANIFSQLIPSIACIVAAYIINHGVNLQDEADHTL